MADLISIPELRFAEFTNEWTSDKLGAIANFTKGKGISKTDIFENGELECIRYGELYTEYDEVITEIKSRTNLDPNDLVLSEENDVIIPASGETLIDIATASCVLKSGVALSGDLNIIKSPLNGVFLSYYLNNRKKINIARLAQGISVVHLYSRQLKSLNLNIPELEEQEKITSFLTTVDNRILLLEQKKVKLEAYKKGIMQKIFNQEIRFKEENGGNFPDWEEVALGKLGDTFNGLTGKTKEHFGSGKPFVQYMQIFSNPKIDISGFGYVDLTEDDNQNTIQYGDIFFTTSSETPNEIGMSSVLLHVIEEAYLNSFCFGYRPKSLDLIVPEFAQFLFRSEKVRKEIIKLAQGSTRYNMSKVVFMKQKVRLPQKNEQQRIASFLIALDDGIGRVSKQIENSFEFKNGLLQKMFV